jgi:hypothetical protein
MSGERGGEVTIGVSANHYADRGLRSFSGRRFKALAMSGLR